MATPNGIFVDCGSSSDTSDPGIRRLNNAASKCAMFRSVRFSRPFQMTTRQRHHSRNQNRAHEHGKQLPRTETSSQGAGQFPVSGAQAADQYERQQQPEAQRRPQQRGFQSRPAEKNRVDRDASRQARHREPVRNPPVAPVENSRDNRHQHCGNPGDPVPESRSDRSPRPALKHDRRWQTGASARFASCTLGLSEAALKREVRSQCQSQFSVKPVMHRVTLGTENCIAP